MIRKERESRPVSAASVNYPSSYPPQILSTLALSMVCLRALPTHQLSSQDKHLLDLFKAKQLHRLVLSGRRSSYLAILNLRLPFTGIINYHLPSLVSLPLMSFFCDEIREVIVSNPWVSALNPFPYACSALKLFQSLFCGTSILYMYLRKITIWSVLFIKMQQF